jgi:hypothetical protein
VFDRYWGEYDHPIPDKITDNRNSMEVAWNPAAGENFTKVMRQMRDGQRFALGKRTSSTRNSSKVCLFFFCHNINA